MAIVLFTDFGAADLYVGQVKAVLQRQAPQTVVIDLLHQAPSFNVRASAHLLAAMVSGFDADDLFLAVVDPGVGGDRGALVMRADSRWYVGPDNGLLSVIRARAHQVDCWRIRWRPPRLSASFHGRDLFAPVAATLARQGRLPGDWLEGAGELSVSFGGGDLYEIIYIDHYGNAHTGVRSGAIPRAAALVAGTQRLPYARVFSEVREGEAFWYENSQDLVELAVNCGSAAQFLNLRIGDNVALA